MSPLPAYFVTLAHPAWEEARACARRLPEEALPEVRLDLYPGEDPEEMIRALGRKCLVTCRRREDGGAWDGDEASRLERLALAAPRRRPTWLDLEWDLPMPGPGDARLPPAAPALRARAPRGLRPGRAPGGPARGGRLQVGGPRRAPGGQRPAQAGPGLGPGPRGGPVGLPHGPQGPRQPLHAVRLGRRLHLRRPRRRARGRAGAAAPGPDDGLALPPAPRGPSALRRPGRPGAPLPGPRLPQRRASRPPSRTSSTCPWNAGTPPRPWRPWRPADPGREPHLAPEGDPAAPAGPAGSAQHPLPARPGPAPGPRPTPTPRPWTRPWPGLPARARPGAGGRRRGRHHPGGAWSAAGWPVPAGLAPAAPRRRTRSAAFAPAGVVQATRLGMGPEDPAPFPELLEAARPDRPPGPWSGSTRRTPPSPPGRGRRACAW